MDDASTMHYLVRHQSADEWEQGIGTFNQAANTLARTTVTASSNSGSAVSFSEGSKVIEIGECTLAKTYGSDPTNLPAGTLVIVSGTLKVSDGSTVSAVGGGESNPAQVSGAEITAGTETEVRGMSPADAVSFITTHGASGGGGSHPGFISGRLYAPAGTSNSHTTLSFSTGYVWYVPLEVVANSTITKLACRAVGGGGNVRMGIHENDNGDIGDLIVEVEVSAATAGDKIATISEDLANGFYWGALTVSSSTSLYVANTTYDSITRYFGRKATDTTYLTTKRYGSHTYGALPDPAPSLTDYNNGSPLLYLGVD